MDIQQIWESATAKIIRDVNEACLMFGGSITSGMRTRDRNAMIGGEPTSFHLDGLAYDVALDNSTDAAKFKAWLQAKGYRVHPTGKELNSRAFHVQFSWPFISKFIRVDHLSHMKAIAENFNHQFEVQP